MENLARCLISGSRLLRHLPPRRSYFYSLCAYSCSRTCAFVLTAFLFSVVDLMRVFIGSRPAFIPFLFLACMGVCLILYIVCVQGNSLPIYRCRDVNVLSVPSIAADGVPLKSHVSQHVISVAEPLAVLLTGRLIHPYFPGHYQLFKPILASYELGGNSFTKLNLMLVKDNPYQIKAVLRIFYKGIN